MRSDFEFSINGRPQWIRGASVERSLADHLNDNGFVSGGERSELVALGATPRASIAFFALLTAAVDETVLVYPYGARAPSTRIAAGRHPRSARDGDPIRDLAASREERRWLLIGIVNGFLPFDLNDDDADKDKNNDGVELYVNELLWLVDCTP